MIITKTMWNCNDKLLSEKAEYKAVTTLTDYLCKFGRMEDGRGAPNCSFVRMVNSWRIFFPFNFLYCYNTVK